MGWSFSTNPGHGRKEEIARVTAPERFAPGYRPLESRVVGNHVWTLVEHGDRRYISLDIIKSGGKGYGWGSKGMSEDSGPFHYDCPLALLDKATEPATEFGAQWRKMVRELHAERKEKKKALAGLETGSVVRYGGVEYRLHSPAGPRKGWNVLRRSDGAMFRMPANRLSRAEVVA